MARKSLVQTVSEMEDISIQEAYDLVKAAKEEMFELLEQGDMEAAYNICETWFGLEPDYIEDIML
jgi:hypothetical protein